MLRTFFCLALCVALSAQEPLPTDAVTAPSGWTPLVRAELIADLILRGRLHIADPIAFEEAMQRGGGYAPMSIDISERLRGRCAKTIEFTCFVVPSVAANGIRPTGEDLLDMDRREVIVLLEQVGRRLFLADRIMGETLMVATADNQRMVRDVIAKNEALAKTPIPSDVLFCDDVLDELDAMAASPERQQEGFWQIQTFGPRALAAVVHSLDDDRRIESESLELHVRRSTNGTGFARVRVASFGEALAFIAAEWANDALGIARDSLARHTRQRNNECLRVFAHYVLEEHRTMSLTSRRTERG